MSVSGLEYTVKSAPINAVIGITYAITHYGNPCWVRGERPETRERPDRAEARAEPDRERSTGGRRFRVGGVK